MTTMKKNLARIILALAFAASAYSQQLASFWWIEATSTNGAVPGTTNYGMEVQIQGVPASVPAVRITASVISDSVVRQVSTVVVNDGYQAASFIHVNSTHAAYSVQWIVVEPLGGVATLVQSPVHATAYPLK